MRLKDVAKTYDALARFYDLGDRWLSRPFARIGRLRLGDRWLSRPFARIARLRIAVGRLGLQAGNSVHGPVGDQAASERGGAL